MQIPANQDHRFWYGWLQNEFWNKIGLSGWKSPYLHGSSTMKPQLWISQMSKDASMRSWQDYVDLHQTHAPLPHLGQLTYLFLYHPLSHAHILQLLKSSSIQCCRVLQSMNPPPSSSMSAMWNLKEIPCLFVCSNKDVHTLTSLVRHYFTLIADSDV